ncbi:MAG: CoA ester lyase, partial [Gammaproteobacteria bacterium]
KNVIAALNDMDWSSCSVSVRINGLDTHYCYRDIVDVVEMAGDKLDTILIPKVNTPADILYVSTMLEQIEAAKKYKPINLHILIETAMGMANVENIAQTCPDRLEAMVFGVADYAASTQARTTNMGGANPDYYMLTHPDNEGARERHWGDQWHYAISRMVVACRAYGLRPIDGPFGDISDPDGYLAVSRSVAALGVEGKWAIHPSQIDLANQVFTPAGVEVDRARRILSAMEEAASAGKGAVALDGRLIDAASIRQAQVLVDKAEQIERSLASR